MVKLAGYHEVGFETVEFKMSAEEKERYDLFRQHSKDCDLTLINAAVIENVQTNAAIYALEKVVDNCLEYGDRFDWLFTYDTCYPPSIHNFWSGRAAAALDIAESVQLMIDLMEQDND